MDKKRFALIGAGTFGQVHAKAYSVHRDAEFAAVCDLDETRARQTASKWGAQRTHTDWREVASDSTIDAVSVATPDFAHTEIAVAMAQAGKHILVEKPLAMTVEECQRTIGAARERGVKLMVDFHNRWNPALYAARRAIDEGNIGAPKFMYFRLSDTQAVPLKMLSWADKSSPLWFLGTHCIDLACWFAGEVPRRAYGCCRHGVLRQKGVDAPDFFLSVLEFPGGAVASIDNSWLLPESSPSIFDLKCEVCGPEGNVHIDTSSHRATEITDKDGVHYVDILGEPSVHGQHMGFMIESVKHFVDCVVNGREPLVPGEVGLEVTRIACALERSAEKGELAVIER